MNRQQRGFTLIELMITLVLSLSITYAIAQVLISSNQSSVSSDGYSQAGETGRFVMSYLAGYIRSAGLDSVDNEDAATPAIIDCVTYPAFIAAGACSTESATGGDETNINDNTRAGDRLSIAWIAPAGQQIDCTGTGFPGIAATDIIINSFWVQNDAASGGNSLYCQGFRFNGVNIVAFNPAQAIANGVEAMHVLYGEAVNPLPISGDRNVSRYVTAAQVVDWNQVYAIKVGILTRSLTDVTNITRTNTFTLLDSQPYAFTDAVNRQALNTTFAVSNYY